MIDVVGLGEDLDGHRGDARVVFDVQQDAAPRVAVLGHAHLPVVSVRAYGQS